MTVEGLKAVKVLSAEGVKTNVTLVFSAAQALLAARAGATYVSPFLGRLDDISMPGIDLIYDITEIFQIAQYRNRELCSQRAQSDPCDRLRQSRSRYRYRSLQGAGADDKASPYRSGNCKIPGRL